ncbi:hypothetical protein OJAV_G00185390 [Oryzias javanicus]|uniref:Uncharacterized protein n=1 Tax=Oryzias javanicus TaxID=123683 RepID=A0A437CDL6_ORYJA|nr:hypothetical protein OJAV_G00185390 [Oryzias javanicus]
MAAGLSEGRTDEGARGGGGRARGRRRWTAAVSTRTHAAVRRAEQRGSGGSRSGPPSDPHLLPPTSPPLLHSLRPVRPFESRPAGSVGA